VLSRLISCGWLCSKIRQLPEARVMDDQVCRRFFLEPQETLHRRYEALRAVFVDGLTLDQAADRFGYRPGALKSFVSRFRARCRAGDPPPFLFARDEDGPLENAPAKTKTDPRSRRLPIVES
jgi:predicted DNA-binding protein (UPF0251 family)